MLSRRHTERLDPHVRRVAIVVVLGMIMSILDTTIVNVALDTLSRDLHAPLNDIQWVVSAYLLALAAVIPLSAWAVRRYSAFRVYMQALVLFTLGSALCGLATTSDQLIAFRALQGLGGGLLAPTGLTGRSGSSGASGLSRRHRSSQSGTSPSQARTYALRMGRPGREGPFSASFRTSLG